MTREQARDAIRAQTEAYLGARVGDLSKPFRCLNPAHPDNHPSMRFDPKRRKAHCFACGADYDVLDLIGIEHGLCDPGAIFAKAHQLFGLSIDGEKGAKIGAEKREGIGGAAARAAKAVTVAVEKPREDFSAYYAQCAARLGDTDYPARRGIGAAVAEAFGLGYDPGYRAAGAVWRALIIPTGKDSYIARNTDPDADKRNRYRKQGASRVFNAEALTCPDRPVFVVEGEFDALSIVTAGGQAVALGSVANARAFLAMAEAAKPKQPLLLAMDNDEAGQRTALQLSEGLQALGLACYPVEICEGYKDANEALQADPEAFAAAVRQAEGAQGQAAEAQRLAYESTCAAEQLSAFLSGVAASANTPATRTGFVKLDEALDGGLYEGLYIIGAISSLGKTSFALQMADQIALFGRDVLIFSLEMARTELIAKSISRWTLLECLAGKAKASNAKTARGITDGKRWLSYSQDEHRLIQRAVETYGAYARRLFIREGVGDIGVSQIREAVEQHIRFTGNTPVVLIDYLQILAPYSERFSDKQNTDKAVLELKRISRDFKAPVIGISSFNRQNYKAEANMEAFKESGAIEYSSDVLIGLQLAGAGESAFDATAEKKKNPRAVELVVLKNRNGAVGEKVALEYYPMFNYFREG